MKKARLSPHHQNLVRRYLLWAYKSTRESFERIERRTTQLMVDEYLLGHFSRNKHEVPAAFRTYVENKRKDEIKFKYADASGKKLSPEYVYLRNRLAAIEAAAKHFLGARDAKRLQALFEEEYTRRILEAREH
jgi:hypothetical protein